MRVLVKVVVYLLLSCRLFAEEPAGIVLYFQDGETTYLLLADEVETSRGNERLFPARMAFAEIGKSEASS